MDNRDTPSKKSLRKRFIIVISALVILFGGIFGWGMVRSYFMQKYFAHFTPPPIAISTTKVRADVWQPNLQAVGSLVAVNGVQVNAGVTGLVVKIYFESGQSVKAGDPLVQLDDSMDVEDLKNLQAQATLAKINYQRQKQLFNERMVAPAGLDAARANMEQTQALADRTRVLIAKKLIKAPFSGKVGIRLINLGQYIAEGTPLVSLQSFDPIDVRFSLPEQNLPALYLGQPVTLTVDAQGSKTFMGKIDAINAEVNPETRNILVQAAVPNPQQLLYPGMFANVTVVLPKQQNILTVPQTAITYNLFGDSVYVVKAQKAFLRYVTVGEKRGNEVAIHKGLVAGEEVVTSGQLKLQDGAAVQVVHN